MKSTCTTTSKPHRKRGLALITVVTLLALATVLLLALFSTTQTEMAATASYADGASARQSADLAVNVVIGQLQKATRQNPEATGREIWTSQPGLARQYRESGRLLAAHKLYSSDQMVINSTGDTDSADTIVARDIMNDVPETDWDEKPEQWVDMNEPVWRQRSAGVSKLIFPIIDPRAYVNGATTGAKERTVEGFSYTTSIKGDDGGGNLNGVQLSASSAASDDNQRVPMPVKWLYVLEDGTLGSLTNDGSFVGAGGESASVTNPIVSRIAFWTDDETSKVNINTAGEGTAWNTPWLYHERDGDWARYQPMMYEYQRYPGHPATVGMSSVLFPNVNMNPPRTVGGSSAMTPDFSNALTVKETIYDLMPKILQGGSMAGSVAVKPGRVFTAIDFENVREALGERLFASVDEFLLRPQLTGGERQQINLGAPVWAGLELPDVVERLHFFLTPNSRAPETNLFGMPKIAMWPLHDSNSETEISQYRTVFDQMIAKSSTIAGVEYFFKRKESFSQNELDISRNNQLYNMLTIMTDSPIPGFGGTTFANKYGLNRDQILVQIFDYVRSTNLYDDSLAETAVGENPAITGAPTGRINAYNEGGGLRSRTFTPMRRSKNDGDVGAISMGSWPGHGQVVPTVRTTGSTKVRGMGRFPTISEAGLLFICCAEGGPYAGGGSALKRSVASGDFPAVPSGSGYTPASYTTPPWDSAPRWYSNFPPLDDSNANPQNKFYSNQYPANDGKPEFMELPGTDPNHPGYNPAYWNWALDKNTPLASGIKRLQATILFEWFIPAAGWTLINPDYEIEVDASDLSVGGQPMFTINGGVVVVKPRNQMNSQFEIYQRGGTTSYRGFLDARKLPAVRGMPPDSGYTNDEQAGTVIANSHRYDLISNFFDVPASGPIPFDGGKVFVRIRRPSTGAAAENFQTFVFNFPAGNFAAPDLIDVTQEPSATLRPDGVTWDIVHQVPPPYWWSFYADGAMGRSKQGVFNFSDSQLTELGGRMRYPGGATNYAGSSRGNFAYHGVRGDTLQSLVIANGDARVVMGKADVPESMFVPHRFYGDSNRRMSHRMVMANQNAGPGIDFGEGLAATNRFIPGSTYPERWLPDIPFGAANGTTAQTDIRRYGDFDRGIANMEDGAYINKPDEGNTLNTFTTNARAEESVPYFSHTWISWSGGSTYFSPNRQVSSPGMFGSLPTGVHDGGVSGAGGLQKGWRTLLFRPQAYTTANAAAGTEPHPGAPASLRWTGSTGALQNIANGGVNPPDYLFMDFFWMPVVEPYAISDPGSTAGKINMNYQIVPFRHITRATGMHAALKGEFIHSVPGGDTDKYLSRPSGAPSGAGETWFRKDSDRNFWHREIDAEATLKLFNDRFRGGFNFITPSQICEMFLLPKRVNPTDSEVPPSWGTTATAHNSVTSTSSIRRFWDRHRPTSDNLKERPYARIYPKLTTRSNTFRVHVRAQTLRKARSSDPTKFEADKDSLVGEYRGSVVVERYLDEKALNDLPLANGRDYARGTATAMMNPESRRPLDEYHRFRVLSQKSFD